MLQETKELLQRELRSDEKILWSGKPQRGIIFHRFSIILVILALFVVALIGGLIMLNNMTHSIRILEILTVGSRFKFTAIGLFASLFISLGLVSLWSFVFYPIQRRKTTYALTNQRAMIFSGLLERKAQSFDLNTINFTSLTEPVNGRSTVIFGNVDPIHYGLKDLAQKQRIVNNWKWFGYKFQLFEVGWPADNHQNSPHRSALGRFEHVENAGMVYRVMRENSGFGQRKEPGILQKGVPASVPAYTKRPGTITFVIDVSASMSGIQLKQAKKGLIGALNMVHNNQVGLISFADGIQDTVPVVPLDQNRQILIETIDRMSASGNTALYEAIKKGIEMTDSAPGTGDDNRAVVVLTDGQANQGLITLDTIIQMKSRDGRSISKFAGFEHDMAGLNDECREVTRKDILGSRLAIKTRHPVQIFFIGIGDYADMEIGRILAEATGAECQKGFKSQGVPKMQKVQKIRDIDIARVLEEFKYF